MEKESLQLTIAMLLCRTGQLHGIAQVVFFCLGGAVLFNEWIIPPPPPPPR